MHPHRRAFGAIQLLGGPLVLGSYVFGASHWPEAVSAMWGGVPEAIRPAYTLWMFVAAAGYLAFTGTLFFSADPERTRFGGLPFAALNVAYAAVLFGSALWLPLTHWLLASPSESRWQLVVADLALVAVGSLALLAAVVSAKPAPARALRRAALLGAVAFCIQTVLLDAIAWTALFPRP